MAELPASGIAQWSQWGQNLKSHIPIKLQVVRTKYFSHTPGSNPLDNPIVAKHLAKTGSGR